MTLGDWDKDIEAMTDSDLERFHAALETLREWPALYKAFKWTGLWVLTITMEYERAKRSRVALRSEL